MDIDRDESSSTSSYEQVLYKKKEGRLELTPSGLSFFLRGAGSADHSGENNNGGGNNNNNGGPPSSSFLVVNIPWTNVQKHQVSPATYPKSLLKLILLDSNAAAATTATTTTTTATSTSTTTFQLPNRDELERIRKDITNRLRASRSSSPSFSPSSKKKRPLSSLNGGGGGAPTSTKPASFGELDATALAVTRSSLLAANPALRQQHAYMVQQAKTVSEGDFWKTHEDLVEEEYAKIAGCAKAGTSSHLLSHLPGSGRVTLGVEEMRQIFILYPAVHKAYEEKVPLELSDEQFWRKYLESEYFHRDRGRMGHAARNHSSGANQQQQKLQQQSGQKKGKSGPSFEEQDARAAAVGTDDLFSRYDQKLKEQQRQKMDASGASSKSRHQGFGRHLAVGQFDLTSTFETERGKLLEGPKDNHPLNQEDDGKGSRVIQKYNRHWAIILHPDLAVAGANLTDVSRRSVQDVLPDDPDPLAGGGVDADMRKLVDFADATEEEADHASGIGHHTEYEPLTLHNVEAYYASQVANKQKSSETDDEAAKRHAIFSKAMATKAESLVEALEKGSGSLPASCFPEAQLGRDLLAALTHKMKKDSITEAASLEMVNKLPEEFRQQLQLYFRRSSELLRHFFGLRRLEQQATGGGSGSTSHSQKLARIVRGMETFYREMEVMRKELPQTETGELMRKMCLPIMEQLDWAFKLHREGAGGGGGGGFVDVEG